MRFVVANINMEEPIGVAITPDGAYAYVTNENVGSVSVIDTATETVVATITVGPVPSSIAITPDGTRAYVTAGISVVVIDIATNTVVAIVPVGLELDAIAITPAPKVPTSKEQCKDGGYLKFGPPAGLFRNQGQCVSYVEHH